MDAATRRFILEIVSSRSDLTLATIRPDGYPQANIVSYASEGFTIYFGTGRDTQKLNNIRYCNKISLAIETPYGDWSAIKALSMAGIAEVLTPGSAECRHAVDLLIERYPAVREMPALDDLSTMAFVRIVPEVVSVLDYGKGFGHTELVRVEADDLRVARP